MTPTIRPARASDIGDIVALLADDELGRTRETPDDLTPYQSAFAALATDPHQHLVVAEDETGVVGTLQLTLIPGLARTAAWRGQIEAVRVRADARDSGVGALLVRWAIAEARTHGCHLVQLTSDRTREQAHAFYERLGFTASHLGYKLDL